MLEKTQSKLAEAEITAMSTMDNADPALLCTESAKINDPYIR